MRSWVARNPADARKQAEFGRLLLFRQARLDENLFCELVLKDEETGQSIRQARIHRMMHDHLAKHPSALIVAHPNSGKTQSITVGRTLWELGNNPHLRFGIAGATENAAAKTTQLITRYLEHSPELHSIFPHLERGKQWGAMAFSVTRNTLAKDPSVQVFSVGTNRIHGARLDRVIMDDILTPINTRSATERDNVKNWYFGSVPGRLAHEGSRIGFLTNPLHPDDLAHLLAKDERFKVLRIRLLDKQGRVSWPERWSKELIDKTRADHGPIEWERLYLGNPKHDHESRFKLEWLHQAIRRGNGRSAAYRLKMIPAACGVYTGVDLGVEDKAESAVTAMATIIVHPNGDRELLMLESGKWGGPEIVQRLVDIHRRYGSIIAVEGNGAQRYLRQFATAVSSAAIKNHITGNNKFGPFGVEKLATEFYNGKWIIPSLNGRVRQDYGLRAEVELLFAELLTYRPNEHTGDRLMALWIAMHAAEAPKNRAQSTTMNTFRR